MHTVTTTKRQTTDHVTESHREDAAGLMILHRSHVVQDVTASLVFYILVIPQQHSSLLLTVPAHTLIYHKAPTTMHTFLPKWACENSRCASYTGLLFCQFIITLQIHQNQHMVVDYSYLFIYSYQYVLTALSRTLYIAGRSNCTGQTGPSCSKGR